MTHKIPRVDLHIFSAQMTYNYYPFLQMAGSLILSGVIHAIIGLTGMIGFLMRFIGPITVIPTMLLIGLSIFKVTAGFCAIHWGIAGM